jgi:hypothetical protein
MNTRSGIEILVDKACGIDRTGIARIPVLPQEPTTPELEPETMALLSLADAAKAWWASFRPEVYTEEEHIANPTVNHLDANRDMDLCNAIAIWVSYGG